MSLKTEYEVDIEHDYRGTDLAFSCPACGYPVLATLGPVATRGRTEDKPVPCKKCMTKYWVEGNAPAFTLRRV